MGPGDSPCSLADKFLIHIASRIPSVRAFASASVEETARVCCFFEDHEIGPHADLKTHPVIDLRPSLQLAQSASV